jgi:hypothetical protein
MYTQPAVPVPPSNVSNLPTVYNDASSALSQIATNTSEEQRVFTHTPPPALSQRRMVPSGSSTPVSSFIRSIARRNNKNLPQHDRFPVNLLINIASQTTTVPTKPVFTTSIPVASVNAALNLSADGTPLNFKKALDSPDAPKWDLANEAEFDRLLGPKIMTAIQPHEQPIDRRGDTTYMSPQVREKFKDGEIEHRVRHTVGGDKINYDGPTSAQTAAMPVVKLLINSVVSDNSNWCTIDISDYYLGTPLPRKEYMRVPIKYIPLATIVKYQLQPYIHNGYVLFEINMGMYGLPQAGLLAQLRLIDRLLENGYHETNTPCLFRHEDNETTFTLIVDDFGIKYTTQKGIDHLIAVLRSLYKIKINWKGDKYIGFNIVFHRDKRKVHLSMPKLLERFGSHITKGADSPAIYTPPSYGRTL